MANARYALKWNKGRGVSLEEAQAIIADQQRARSIRARTPQSARSDRTDARNGD
jgi:ribosomal protein L13E